MVHLKTRDSFLCENFHESHSARELNAPCITEKTTGLRMCDVSVDTWRKRVKDKSSNRIETSQLIFRKVQGIGFCIMV